mmetsp:Transcript_1139/g.3645  ORF Transcript_1139/g.3645 Transcript_1139/m.3645 type:complete len:208 (-) Transcript_1139:289-912(-)
MTSPELGSRAGQSTAAGRSGVEISAIAAAASPAPLRARWSSACASARSSRHSPSTSEPLVSTSASTSPARSSPSSGAALAKEVGFAMHAATRVTSAPVASSCATKRETAGGSAIPTYTGSTHSTRAPRRARFSPSSALASPESDGSGGTTLAGTPSSSLTRLAVLPIAASRTRPRTAAHARLSKPSIAAVRSRSARTASGKGKQTAS